MRILLLQSYLGRSELPVAPLGLLVIASKLKQHTVQLFDPNIYNDPYRKTEEFIDLFQPEVIGLSLRNIDTTNFRDQFLYFEHFVRYANLIKRRAPFVKLFVGGSGFSLYPEQIMEAVPAIDTGFYLEAEQSFPTYLENQDHPAQIKGLYLRNGEGQILYTGMPERLSFDQIPAPAWELLDVTPYLRPSIHATIGVETKRGCAQHCAYCTYPALSGSKTRLKSPDRVLTELKILREKGVRRIFFCDPVFNDPLEHAVDICQKIVDAGLDLHWSAYHQDRFLTDDYIKLALRAGCEEFYLSPDAASEQGLKILGKSTTVESLHRSLDLLAGQQNARVSYNFYATVPGTGWETTRAALRFLKQAKRRFGRRFNRWKFSYIRIEPGTRLAQNMESLRLKSPTGILPRKSADLNHFFFRKSKSFWLNMLLTMHYYWGKYLGRKHMAR